MFDATVANGVPDGDLGRGVLRLALTGEDRRGEAGRVELRAVRVEVVLQVRRAGADAGQVLLQGRGGGDELHLLVDERGRHGGQHLLPRERLAGEAAPVADVLALLRLEDLGHHLRDLPGEVGAGRRQLGLGQTDVALVGQLQDELVPDLGLEVIGHEGGGGGRVVADVLARAGTHHGRQLLLPLDERYSWELR